MEPHKHPPLCSGCTWLNDDFSLNYLIWDNLAKFMACSRKHFHLGATLFIPLTHFIENASFHFGLISIAMEGGVE